VRLFLWAFPDQRAAGGLAAAVGAIIALVRNPMPRHIYEAITRNLIQVFLYQCWRCRAAAGAALAAYSQTCCSRFLRLFFHTWQLPFAAILVPAAASLAAAWDGGVLLAGAARFLRALYDQPY